MIFARELIQNFKSIKSGEKIVKRKDLEELKLHCESFLDEDFYKSFKQWNSSLAKKLFHLYQECLKKLKKLGV
ncbi:hypothetical protein DRN69_08690 [Candidatus Pacearchaeota archaeon]|nr:MAG: hypothetical protein DRN69_08690 [Candidatus Pacearchaeota archaeon]